MYLTNNVVLHGRAGKKDKGMHKRVADHHDLVFKQTLLRSSLVKDVVVCFNRVEGNTRKARDKRRRILSRIARDFTYVVLKALDWRIPDVGTRFVNRSLTKNMHCAARTHAGAFGPGGEPIFLPHRKKVTLSAAVIKKVFSHVMNGDHVQKLVFGTNDLVLSTGETFQIPPVARKFLRTHLWCDFCRKHTGDNGCYDGGVSRTDYLEIISTATSSQEKCYAALDQTKVRCGSENFEAGFRLVQDICRLLPSQFVGHEETLKELIAQVKKHCKTDLPKHLETHSKCVCHCLTHLFGGQGEASSNECVECEGHPERCKECEQGFVIVAMIQGMIDKVNASDKVSAEDIEDLQWRLDKYVSPYVAKYVAPKP